MSSGKPNLIKRYRAFRENLQGYVEISAAEFRDSLVPLVNKRGKWSTEEDQYVLDLANRGAGHALQQLFGINHGAAKKILGTAMIIASPVPKGELETHMRDLTKNCLSSCWSFNNFVTFQAYLDSDMTPTQLQTRLQKQDEANELAAGENAEKESDKLCPTPATDSSDKFAEMYRSSNPAFKQVVQEHLTRAALTAKVTNAPRIAPKVQKSDNASPDDDGELEAVD